jgi:hypothetical protein
MNINSKGFLSIFLTIALLVGGIVAGTYLVKNPQIFFSKAAESQTNFPDYVRTFRLQNPKSEMEKFLNPFGETWESKQSANPDIPAMLAGAFDRTKSGSYGISDRAASFSRLLPSYYPNQLPQPSVDYYLDLTEGYKNLLRNANTPYTFYNQGGGVFSNRPRYNMPSSNIVIRELDKINPNLKQNSYYVINFVEETDLAGYENLKEQWYVHRKGTDPTKPENRLKAAGGQDVLDVTIPEFQQHMATGVAKAMQDNQLDWLLVDGAGDGLNRPRLLNSESPSVYPDHFNSEAYFTGTLQTLGALKAKLNPLGKEVIFNPIQPDSIADERITQVQKYLEVTDGAYWENPFRTGNRDYYASTNGPDYYYTQLQKFFDLANSMNKKLIIESDTVNDYRQDPNNNCPLVFQCEYAEILAEKGYTEALVYEQKIARRHLSMYLLFQTNPLTNLYSHYTLAEPLSYETSEATFADYDLKIGKPLAKMEKVADNIFKRQFEKGLVFVNYSKSPYNIGVNVLTCDDYHQSICQKPHYVTADGLPVTTYTLEPETAQIFVLPSVLTPYNPSFETVWNWKPNQLDWGSVDYTKARTGRASFKISPNSTGSPGLTQAFNFKPNTQYQWKGYVKSENSTKPNITVAYGPVGTTVTAPAKAVPVSGGVYVYADNLPSGTNDWREAKISFSTGSQGGWGNFYVIGEANNGGTVWFDDVTLTELGPVGPNVSFSNASTSSYCLTPTQPRVHLQWNPIGGTTYYRVFLNNADGTKTQLYDGDGIAINLDNLQSNKSYTFSLEARTNWNGTFIGSATHTLTTASCSAPTPTPVAKPNVVASRTSSYCNGASPIIHIEWNSLPNTAIYKIFRSTTVPGSGIKVGETSGTAMNDTNTTSSTSYTYTIESSFSNGSFVQSDPYLIQAAACAAPSPSTAPVVQKIDVKRLDHSVKPNYLEKFFTAKQNEIDFLKGRGWSEAGKVFKAPITGSAGALMAKRLTLNDTTHGGQIRTWAINSSDITEFKNLGFAEVSDGDFYAYPTQQSGTVGVTRMKLFSSTYNRTFYTFAFSSTEISSLTAQGWSVQKANVFYVFP